MKIKAVLIDIDNTLLDFNKSALAAMNNTASAHSVTFPEGYFDVFLKINDELWTQLQCQSITKQDIYKRRWRRIFDELGIRADSDAFEEDFRKEMRSTAITVDGAEEILRYLSEKYPVYAASNASKHQQELRLKSAGLSKYLSGIFTSEEIGYQKPAKEFFDACNKKLSPVLPEETVMIGDSVEADIAGAKAFGIITIWFNYYGKICENYEFTDYYVNNLEEIKELL